MSKRTNMPRQRVTSERRIGGRLYVDLECGHSKLLSNPRNPVPKICYCPDCPPRD